MRLAPAKGGSRRRPRKPGLRPSRPLWRTRPAPGAHGDASRDNPLRPRACSASLPPAPASTTRAAVRIRDCQARLLAGSRDSHGAASGPAAQRLSIKGRVAVIGAGPAGLSCAIYLALAGVPVTVFEARPDGPGRRAGQRHSALPHIAREDLEAYDIDRIGKPRRRVPLRHRGSRDLDTSRLPGLDRRLRRARALPVPERSLDLEGELASGASTPSHSSSQGSGRAEGQGLPLRRPPSGRSRGRRRQHGHGRGPRCALTHPGIKEGPARLSPYEGQEMPADKEELEEALAEGGRSHGANALPESSRARSDAKPSLIAEAHGARARGTHRVADRPSPQTGVDGGSLRPSRRGRGRGPWTRALLEPRFGIPEPRDGTARGSPRLKAKPALPIQAGRAEVYVGRVTHARGPSSIIAAYRTTARARGLRHPTKKAGYRSRQDAEGLPGPGSR